jgi:hypothetical protein
MMTTAPEHTDEMYRLAQKVRTKRDLEHFVDRLAEDYESNREVWENHSLPDFLLALADCSRRSEELVTAVPQQGTEESGFFWQYMARLLLGASVVR